MQSTSACAKHYRYFSCFALFWYIPYFRYGDKNHSYEAAALQEVIRH